MCRQLRAKKESLSRIRKTDRRRLETPRKTGRAKVVEGTLQDLATFLGYFDPLSNKPIVITVR